MPWLVVTGTASYGSFADGKFRHFEPGVHHVDEIQDDPLRPARVILTDQRPELAPRPDGAPLTLEDIRLGVDYGVRLRQNDAPATDDAEEWVEAEYDRVPDAYPCRFCARSFTTGERLEWHIEFAHSIHHEVEQEEQEAESTEADERLAKARPAELAPWERELLDA
jgi:hypothetical protein